MSNKKLIEYVLIPKSTLEAYEINKEHILTPEETATLTVHSKLIKKLIEQKAVNIQFEIGEGKWKDKTDLGLELVKSLFEIGQELSNIKETFEQYVSINKDN